MTLLVAFIILNSVNDVNRELFTEKQKPPNE